MRVTTAATKEIRGLRRGGDEFARAIYQHSSLPLRVFEAARIATAVINGCALCMNWRTARDAGSMTTDGGVINNGPEPDEAFYRAVLEGRGDGLTVREQLAARYASAMGRDPRGLAADEELWTQMHEHFTEVEIADLTYCTAGWMGMGRVAHVLGFDEACAVPATKDW